TGICCRRSGLLWCRRRRRRLVRFPGRKAETYRNFRLRPGCREFSETEEWLGLDCLLSGKPGRERMLATSWKPEIVVEQRDRMEKRVGGRPVLWHASRGTTRSRRVRRASKIPGLWCPRGS